MKMDHEEYIKLVLKTESIDITAIQERLRKPQIVRLLHAAKGLVTESAELMDMLKKHIFYGSDLDLVNVEEELGDLNWYQALAIDSMREMGHSVDLAKIRSKNIAKLQKRYKGSFSEDAARNRDLEAERKILEDGPEN